jgi:Stage II sporulation protein E (SpoIIE)
METLDAAAAAPAAESQPRSPDLKHPRLLPTYDLYRRLRHLVVGLEGARSTEALIAQLLALFADTATPDGEPIRAAHAYHRRSRAYARVASRGQGGPAWLGECLAADHPLVRELRRSGVASTAAGDADTATVAAVAFGGKREFLLVFVLADPLPPQETASFLAGLGSLADMALRHRDLAAAMTQARQVQTSLLLAAPPVFPGYEIAFGSRPAAVVGGDVYDFLSVQPGTLGVAVGDAAGHGMAAALQARDVIVGLRMGVEESEIHRNGTLVYVNAGHPPPLVLRAGGGESALASGGPVMGLKLPPVAYEPAFESLGPGDLAVFFTDGITEALDRNDQEFGHERLVAALRERPDEPVASLVERAFATLDVFSEGLPQSDDQTLVLVRRLP